MTPFFAAVGPAMNTITSSWVDRLDTPTPSTHVPASLLTVSFFVLSIHRRPWIDEYSSPSSFLSASLMSGDSTTHITNATSLFADAARISSSVALTVHFLGRSTETLPALLL